MVLHLKWDKMPVQRQVKCVHTEAKKYTVKHMLTKGTTYDVINETDEFIFIVDDSGRMAGYYKEYFTDV